MSNWLSELKDSSRKEWMLAVILTVILVFAAFILFLLFAGSFSAVWEWFLNKEIRSAASWVIAGLAIVFALALIIAKRLVRNHSPRTLASNGSIPPVMEIIVLIGNPDFELELYVQKFRKCRSGETSIDGLKEDEEGLCPLIRSEGFFKILKYDLTKRGFEKGDPYKFYCRIPNDPNTIDKCYALLCRQGYIVTGEGEPDANDNNFYRVWFVSGREKTYPKPESLYYLNNMFVYPSSDV